jgi:uncharacterized 2Fe-2S/4Fe-4S cluster protein (DUF4445 family)
MKTVKLTVRTNSTTRTFFPKKGKTVAQGLQESGVLLNTPCGGYGTCGKCRIRFVTSPPPPVPADKNHLSLSELTEGFRLACQHTLTKHTQIEIDAGKGETALHILSDGLDLDRGIDPDIAVSSPEEPVLGLAVDLGTTTLVLTLHDLKSGKRFGLISAKNPQEQFGTDIISRATAATESPKNLKTLQNILIQTLNELIRSLTNTPEKIVHAVLAGNAVMTHLFLGISLDSLVTAPYTAPVTEIQILEGKASGLPIHPGGKITVLPGIGSFIGGDISADLLICREILHPESTFLLMDFGTNCETVLKTPNFIHAASAPAGPVMEGAGISHGMQAEPGAVSDLMVDEKGTFQAVTIENQRARGICGSGLIHTIYTLWKENIISPDGRFNATSPHVDKDKGFRIDGDIYLTPQDIRAFQMAKAAIAATWKMLMKDENINLQDLDFIILAGGFGHYIRPEAGKALGLFPDKDTDTFIYMGNGCLAGCELIMKNKKYVPEIKILAKDVKHSEMAGRENFQETYVMNMGIGDSEF